MVNLKGLMMILELHQQGLSVSAIAERTGHDRKTVRKTIARGLVVPKYAPRRPRPTLLDPYRVYLHERVAAWPELSGARLLREVRERGYVGGITQLNDFLRSVRPPPVAAFEVRFETPAGRQAQVDFAHFIVEFDDEPGVQHRVWLFAMVLGHSRYLQDRDDEPAAIVVDAAPVRRAFHASPTDAARRGSACACLDRTGCGAAVVVWNVDDGAARQKHGHGFANLGPFVLAVEVVEDEEPAAREVFAQALELLALRQPVTAARLLQEQPRVVEQVWVVDRQVAAVGRDLDARHSLEGR